VALRIRSEWPDGCLWRIPDIISCPQSVLVRMSVHIINTGQKSLSTSGSSKRGPLLLRKMAAWQSLLSASSAENRGNFDSGRRAGNWSRFFSSGACGWSTEPSASRDKAQIRICHACVLLASGGCTRWNKLEFLTGKRVSSLFSTAEPSWQSGGCEFDPRQLHQ